MDRPGTEVQHAQQCDVCDGELAAGDVRPLRQLRVHFAVEGPSCADAELQLRVVTLKAPLDSQAGQDWPMQPGLANRAVEKLEFDTPGPRLDL